MRENREKIEISANILKAIFQNVYFINGTAYAGKSTMIKLLSEKYDGICCGENYHDQLTGLIDEVHQPNLWYLKNCQDWQGFVSRTPLEYAAWIEGCSREAQELELVFLIRYAGCGKRVFVDTNICPEVLRKISDDHHVLFLLSDEETAVNRFFEREDREKQFLYQVLLRSEKGEQAFENYRACLRACNNEAVRQTFLRSGFRCIRRDENRSIQETLKLVEQHFQLK